MSHQVEAYEGKEPYIFISYAHKDTDTVLPILAHLRAQGYRLWYDDGIAPGSEWPEYIATHLNGCQVVIAFVSPNSIASPNCRREVTYALSKNKVFLGVILEPTKMSAGMELQLSAQQCILRYNYIDPQTGEIDEKRFLEKLYSVSEIQGCRDLNTEELEEQIRKEREAAQAAVAKLEALKQAEAEKRAAQEAALELERMQKEQAARIKEEKRQAEAAARAAGQAGGKNKLLIPIIAGAAVVVLALVLLLGRGGNKAGGAATADNAGSEVTDGQDTGIAPEGMELDGSLEFNGMGSVEADHVYVNDSVLQEILKEDNMIAIRFHDCFFDNVDLTQLSKFENLDRFEMTNCVGVTDYSFLSECERITKLNLENCGIEDGQITEIGNLGITHVNLRGNHLTDVSFLDDMTRLQELDLSGNPITKLPCAAKSADHLMILYVSDTALDAVTLREIGACNLVYDLQIAGVKTQDLSFTQGMENLITLHAERCGLTDISALQGKKELQYVYLSENDLTSTAALSEMQGDKYSLFIDVHDNQITDWTLPSKVQLLLAYGNTARTGETLADKLTDGQRWRTLVCDYEEMLLDEENRCSSIGDASLAWRIIPLNAPRDKELDLKDAMDNCKFMTREEFEALYEEKGEMSKLPLM